MVNNSLNLSSLKTSETLTSGKREIAPGTSTVSALAPQDNPIDLNFTWSPQTPREPLGPAANLDSIAEALPAQSEIRSRPTLQRFVQTVRELGGKLEPFTVPTARQRLFILGQSIAEVTWHLCHPVKIGGRLQILKASLSSEHKLSEKGQKGENPIEVTQHLQGSMGRAYFAGLVTAVSFAAVLGGVVQHAADSPLLGTLLATITDYVVQVGVFSSLFKSRHREYYTDKNNPEESDKRQKHFFKLLASDLGVSACIYGFTFTAMNLLAAASPTFASYASIFTAGANFVLFSTVALGNVMVSAKYMTPSYNEFLRGKSTSP